MSTQEAILLAFLAFTTAVEMKAAMDGRSNTPIVWPPEVAPIEQACAYAELDIGCVLVTAA